MTAETCGTCRFFQPLAMRTVLRREHQFTDPLTGECRRFPPRMVGPEDHVTPGYGRVPIVEWPHLASSDWCGEHVIHPEQGMPT